METQKGPYKDYSPSKRGLYGFPFGGVYGSGFRFQGLGLRVSGFGSGLNFKSAPIPQRGMHP